MATKGCLVSVVVVVVLLPLVAQADLLTFCSDFCSRLPTESQDCVDMCESLLQDEFQLIETPDELDPASDEMAAEKRGAYRNYRVPYLRRNSRQKSAFVRIGRDAPDYDKRASSFVRIGRSRLFDNGEDAKRASSFVRIGRDGVEKRPSNFVRIGKSMPETMDGEKRASSFVRIGRPSSFVRIGKSYTDDMPAQDAFVLDESKESAEKRASSFVRIGKKDVDDSKRTSSFVRIGKALGLSSDGTDKRTSSFVRIGKRDGGAMRGEPEEIKRQSNFVRIGKKSTSEES